MVGTLRVGLSIYGIHLIDLDQELSQSQRGLEQSKHSGDG